jgi:aspartate/methionine/tyrosine aminotransferase
MHLRSRASTTYNAGCSRALPRALPAPTVTDLAVPTTPAARNAVQRLVASQIREVANAGMGDPAILPFWFGEPDEVTPAFIRDAAAKALASGDTFYTENFGIPELRTAIAGYVSRLHRATAPDEIAVTASGMSALMLAAQALIDAGDRVVVVTPVWPNLAEIPKILGGNVVRVPLAFRACGWSLDLDRLVDALAPGTRALIVNAPNNPTGWMLSAAEQHTLLAHCRRHGIWIIADDVYERLTYGDAGGDLACAPSFLAQASPGERLVSTNSFSKAWRMTGFRLGWIVAPPALMADLGKLIEYNTSCSPGFVQRAGIAALAEGEPVIAHSLERYRRARDTLLAALHAIPGVEAAPPPGAMYAFFRVAGVTDSLAFCKRLVREAKLGLAPGSAFGPEGEGFVRWCFAASEARLAEGVARLRAFLAA